MNRICGWADIQPVGDAGPRPGGHGRAPSRAAKPDVERPSAISTQFRAAVVTMWHAPANRARAGGDWCATLPIADDILGLTVGDVSGHGEAVAESMAKIRSSFLHAIEYVREPAAILSIVNSVAMHRGSGVFVTAIAAFYNRRSRMLVFANAGHPPPMLVTNDACLPLASAKSDLPLGVFAHHEAASYALDIPPEASLVFYTDGVTECKRDPIRGESELAAAAGIVHRHRDVDAAGAIAERMFRDGHSHDDAAIMVLRTEPLPSSKRSPFAA